MQKPEEEQQSELAKRFQEQTHKSNVKQFIRSYELKQNAIGEMATIYAKHAMSEHFDSTFKAAVFLIVLPSLTNLYYALRPHSTLAGIMPFAIPLVCLANYVYFLNNDLQNYCFTKETDAEIIRQLYDIIYQFSYFDRNRSNFMTKLQNFRQDQKEQLNRTEELV